MCTSFVSGSNNNIMIKYIQLWQTLGKLICYKGLSKILKVNGKKKSEKCFVFWFGFDHVCTSLERSTYMVKAKPKNKAFF